MGWTPCNNITIERIFEPARCIMVKWHDAQLGKQERRFEPEDTEIALEFLAKTFKELCM